MTKKEVYKRTAEMWGWLAENPEKSKSDWPKWKRNGGRYKEVEHDCYACEYTLSHEGGLRCSLCPLGGLWDNYCIAPNSPYEQWCWNRKIENCKSSKKYARIIADFAEKKYKEECKNG